MTSRKWPRDPDRSAQVQYMGIVGSTNECQEAIVRLIQCNESITHARILTCGSSHAFLLKIGVGDAVIIQDGFASGYGGGGPHGLSYVLVLMDHHGTDIDEVEITSEVMERLGESGLTNRDLEEIEDARPVHGRWRDYIFESDYRRLHGKDLWEEFPEVIPYAVIDPRLMDIAMSFRESPDESLLRGYRRLESIVREKLEASEGFDQDDAVLSGVKLFRRAFLESNSTLWWGDIDPGEHSGRGQLFTGAFSALRNPRAHREDAKSPIGQLSELLLLNALFRLESQAVHRPRSVGCD